jgi:hypothetical protein
MRGLRDPGGVRTLNKLDGVHASVNYATEKTNVEAHR